MATPSMARRSGWFSAAPNEPNTWNTATPSAVSHTELLGRQPMAAR
jgi:hypothetical protein